MFVDSYINNLNIIYFLYFRLPEEQSALGGQMRGLLARREAVPLLDPAHGEDAVVLLVRHRAGALQHDLRGRRALQAAEVAHRILV